MATRKPNKRSSAAKKQAAKKPTARKTSRKKKAKSPASQKTSIKKASPKKKPEKPSNKVVAKKNFAAELLYGIDESYQLVNQRTSTVERVIDRDEMDESFNVDTRKWISSSGKQTKH